MSSDPVLDEGMLTADDAADWRHVQEIMDLGLWDWRLEPDTVRWSSTLLELLGIDPSKIDAPDLDTVLDAIHPADRAHARKHIRDALETGSYEPFEFRVPRPDGSTAWFASRGEVVLDEDGTPDRITGTVHEITERKQLAEELETAKLAAEEAARAKSMFLANVSHEIRTPMTAILGLSNLLLEQDLDPDVREDLETIQVSGEHLLSILEDVLDLSKVDEGKLEIVEEPFDLRACIEGVLGMMAHEAGGKDLDLGYWMDEGVPEAVVGDAGRLRQVLVNLVSNGVKFTEEGGVTVLVEVGDEVGLQLVFRVEDTGIGIAEEDQERLFKPFERGERSSTSSTPGTGLGLAISKRLVELMDGSIELASAPGEGSTFTVRLPLEAAEQTPERPWKAAPETFRGTRVLVVDDSRTNRTVHQRMLARLGYDAEAAVDGREALDRFENGQRFDLVLLDVQMPGIDGFETTRRIREDVPEAEQPRIVALTAHASTEDRERCLAAGMDGYLAKPVRMGALVEVLETVVEPVEAQG